MSRRAGDAEMCAEKGDGRDPDEELIVTNIYWARGPPLIREPSIPEVVNLNVAPRDVILEILSCAGAFIMPRGVMMWNCPHILSGFGTGSRPVEHVVSGCLLGRTREDDDCERTPGWCRHLFQKDEVSASTHKIRVR